MIGSMPVLEVHLETAMGSSNKKPRINAIPSLANSPGVWKHSLKPKSSPFAELSFGRVYLANRITARKSL